MVNDGWQNYNALQIELRRQFRNGIMGHVNYTTATPGRTAPAAQPEPLRAVPRQQPAELDAGRSASNITHIVNANLIVDLPFGQGKRWLNKGGLANAIAGGWQLSAIIHWQSRIAGRDLLGPRHLQSAPAAREQHGRGTLSPRRIKQAVRGLQDGRRPHLLDRPEGRSARRPRGRRRQSGQRGRVRGADLLQPDGGPCRDAADPGLRRAEGLQLDAALAKRFPLVGRYTSGVPRRGVQRLQLVSASTRATSTSTARRSAASRAPRSARASCS